MFIPYNQTYEKIAMGLLSYVPDLKNVSRLQSEIDSYRQDNKRKLFVWKDEPTENIVGLIGSEISDTTILVRHIAVSPSFRNEGISYSLLDGLHAEYPEKTISGILETASLIAKWSNKMNEQDPAENNGAEKSE